ncbi:hypothetical protein [Nostoc sp.]|uniref:hypothetical protein n=1 Tax=Nostoc sp. TaxID=1180 RepID=UPI002FFA5683
MQLHHYGEMIATEDNQRLKTLLRQDSAKIGSSLQKVGGSFHSFKGWNEPLPADLGHWALAFFPMPHAHEIPLRTRGGMSLKREPSTEECH